MWSMSNIRSYWKSSLGLGRTRVRLSNVCFSKQIKWLEICPLVHIVNKYLSIVGILSIVRWSFGRSTFLQITTSSVPFAGATLADGYEERRTSCICSFRFSNLCFTLWDELVVFDNCKSSCLCCRRSRSARRSASRAAADSHSLLVWVSPLSWRKRQTMTTNIIVMDTTRGNLRQQKLWTRRVDVRMRPPWWPPEILKASSEDMDAELKATSSEDMDARKGRKV